MKLPVVPLESSFIAAPIHLVVSMRDSLAIPTSGNYCRADEVAWVNGQTALACSVGRLEPASDGSGIQRTMSGLKYTLNIRDGGYTWMHVRRRGISLVFTRKVSNANGNAVLFPVNSC